MSGTEHIHSDCRHFAPVDVIKGICHKTKELIKSDGKACSSFERLSKCAYCTHYEKSEENAATGICQVSKNRFMAYAGMTSATCEDYNE